MPDISYYRVDEMRGGEKKEFVAWYESHKSQLFDNRVVLGPYFQDDATVLG